MLVFCSFTQQAQQQQQQHHPDAIIQRKPEQPPLPPRPTTATMTPSSSIEQPHSSQYGRLYDLDLTPHYTASFLMKEAIKYPL